MEEFQQVVAMYQKQKKYERNVIILSISLMIVASIFVAIDVVRINPFIVYLVGMGIVLLYTLKKRVASKKYDQLQKYLKLNNLEISKNKELVFFIDYQLGQSFNEELKSKVKNEKLAKKIVDIEFLYESLAKN